MSPEFASYLLGFMLDACFMVGAGMLYVTAMGSNDRLMAGAYAFSFSVSCVGAAIFLALAVFV